MPITSRPRGGNEADINPGFQPGYLTLHRRDELKKRAQELWDVMKRCELCPRRCGANRLPDLKYSDGRMAAQYSSGADTYPETAKAALLEMHQQVGVAHPAPDDLMYRGLMVRHLVMPNGVSGTKAVVELIAQNLAKETYLNLMSQYMPAFMASQYLQLTPRITRSEYSEAVEWARAKGLTNLDIQGYRN